MDIFERHLEKTESENKERSKSNVKKEIIVKFDADAYEDYKKLQIAVRTGKYSSGKPTYSQLLDSINYTITNIKSNPYYGNLIPRKNITKNIIKNLGRTRYSELNS